MKILVAEDDLDTGYMYLKILENNGHRVTLARNGTDCLALYKEALEDLENRFIRKRKEKVQPFDAVIVDFKMPKMNGLDVAKEIASISPQQRIIIISSYDSFFFEEEIQNLDLRLEVLTKPFSYIKLTSLLEK